MLCYFMPHRKQTNTI